MDDLQGSITSPDSITRSLQDSVSTQEQFLRVLSEDPSSIYAVGDRYSTAIGVCASLQREINSLSSTDDEPTSENNILKERIAKLTNALDSKRDFVQMAATKESISRFKDTSTAYPADLYIKIAMDRIANLRQNNNLDQVEVEALASSIPDLAKEYLGRQIRNTIDKAAKGDGLHNSFESASQLITESKQLLGIDLNDIENELKSAEISIRIAEIKSFRDVLDTRRMVSQGEVTLPLMPDTGEIMFWHEVRQTGPDLYKRIEYSLNKLEALGANVQSLRTRYKDLSE